MTWTEVLDRLEADAVRLAGAAPDELEAVCATTLQADDLDGLGLPPLPAELAERATAVLRTVTEAEAAITHRVSAARRGLDTLAAAGAAEAPPARYIDQSA